MHKQHPLRALFLPNNSGRTRSSWEPRKPSACTTRLSSSFINFAPWRLQTIHIPPPPHHIPPPPPKARAGATGLQRFPDPAQPNVTILAHRRLLRPSLPSPRPHHLRRQGQAPLDSLGPGTERCGLAPHNVFRPQLLPSLAFIFLFFNYLWLCEDSVCQAFTEFACEPK